MSKNKSNKNKEITAHPSGIPVGNSFATFAEAVASATVQTKTANTSKTEYGYVKQDVKENLFLSKFTSPPTNHEIKNYLDQILPPKFHWTPEDPRKDTNYYQHILTETNSCRIDHKLTNETNFSKCLIFQIITPTTWGAPWSYHAFKTPYNQITAYNYYDYIQAWDKAFLIESYTHSWFISFHPACRQNTPKIPVWFIQWWKKFGANPLIFPPEIKGAYDLYSSKSGSTGPWQCLHPIYFSIIFRLAWIACWSYKATQQVPTEPFLIHREYSVKWWRNYGIYPKFPELIAEFFKIGDEALEKLTKWSKTQEAKRSQKSPSPLLIPKVESFPVLKTISVPESSKRKTKTKITNEEANMYEEFLKFQEFMKAKSSAASSSKSSNASIGSQNDDDEDAYNTFDPFNL